MPLFLAERRRGVVRLTEPLAEAAAETEPWLLKHAEARHLRRGFTVYAHLAPEISLP